MATYLTPDNTSNYNGVTVKEYLLTKHNPNKIDMPTAKISTPLGITIHNTDWINVNSATTPAEQYTRATVNGNMHTVRVHYYVDDKCAWQNLPLTLSGWHAADGNGNGNRKTIAIECIMANSTDSKSLKSEDNCAKLTAYLLHKYGLTVEKGLFTHTHWLNVRDGRTGTNDYLNTKSNSYKNCPAYILPHWSTFKEKVRTYLNTLNGSSSSNSNDNNNKFKEYYVKINSDDGFVNIRKTPVFKDSDIVGTIKNGGKYTIVDEITVDGVKFGKLKSGAGYIALSCTTKY